jgi:diguanylate cyclase (GGDEF)-like protein/PAS domain S-box-containing protein
MTNPTTPGQSRFESATATVLQAQYIAAERIVNLVRLGVLMVLAIVAALWAPALTLELNLVNVAVLTPMLGWAVFQHLRFHRRHRWWKYLSAVNTYLDITAVSTLLFGYGLQGLPDLAVKSPIWTAYFLILAARPFTGSPRRAAAASATVAVQYAVVALFFLLTSRVALLSSPLESVRAAGTSWLDEMAKVLLLVVGGVVVTYASAWNERTLRRAIEASRSADERFRAVFEHSATGIVVLAADSTIRDSNLAFEQFLGASRADLENRRLADFAPPEHADLTTELLREVGSGKRDNASAELRFVRGDGRVSWGAVTLSRAEELNEFRLIAMVQDITGRKALEAQLLHQAFHDPLTGLANRALFLDRLEHALTRVVREQERLAVLFLDLDNFKMVNDTQGHAAGDRLLGVVAERLLHATRGCDTVARLGGDEFAVLLDSPNGREGIEVVAQRITRALGQPVATDSGREVVVSASVGIATWRGGESAGELLRDADVAMYSAKAQARGSWVHYDPRMHAALVERVALEADLRRAIEDDELNLVYQPIVDVTSGLISGAEALLRWSHIERGAVPPSAFIPVAEESGMIIPLGTRVLGQACHRAAAWNAVHPERPFTVTVNISGLQLPDPGLPAVVERSLKESGLQPHCLVLEITETVIMQETESTLARLRELKRLGVRLAIDDFGTGYSSLSYLQRFPVDILKIDRSFTDGLLRGGNDAAFVRTIVSLAETLGLRTIAEGVEHWEQFEELASLGCDAVQGFLFSRPVPPDEIMELLASPTGLVRSASFAA